MRRVEFVTFVAKNSLPSSSCDGSAKMFSNMFPDRSWPRSIELNYTNNKRCRVSLFCSEERICAQCVFEKVVVRCLFEILIVPFRLSPRVPERYQDSTQMTTP